MTPEGDKTDQARARTEWAEDRTVLANERTFAGWMRTGMAALAVAIGMRAVFRPAEPEWAAKAVASIFVAVALYIFWQAWRNACHTHARLDQEDVQSIPGRGYGWIAAIMAVGAVATGAILWSL